ncbi:hypothetical protein NA57DRAFT_25350, partial [Rhizodiscina lignyota]
YSYRPLRYNDSIRVIQLHCSVDDSAPILISIWRARISDARPEYEALSYTWGEKYPRRKIFCRNPASVLEVTQNCYSSLRRLRKDTDRYLWIDAISINQENDIERSVQVRIMDRIFASASGVIVDLGEATPGSRLLFEELADADADADQTREPTGKFIRQWPNEEIIQELEYLYQRPWFSRIWVVQEAVVNPTVTVMCGTDQSSLAALESCNMGYHHGTRVTLKEDPPVLRLFHEYNSIGGLWNILLATRKLYASDPRDRVFALLSLLESNSDIRHILIDYTQSPEVIFTRVAKLLLSHTGLWLLAAARHGHTLHMPSWVPDWSQNYYCDIWGLNLQKAVENEFSEEAEASRTDQRDASCTKHTSHESTPKMSGYGLWPVGNHDALKVKGVRFGTIRSQSAAFSFFSFDDAEQAFLELLNIFHCRHSRIFVPPDLLAGEYGSLDFKSDLHRIASSLEPGDRFHSETIANFRTTMDNCRIFVTEHGEIGIAPQNSQEGDIVCIVRGAYSPCILRQIPGGFWHLVSGDCFL